MTKITNIKATEVLDSRGNPTIEATVYAGDNSASFAVPSGASAGSHEALEKRDGDQLRFRGLGVLEAVKSIEEKITPALIGVDASNQKEIDRIMLELDGTPQKSNLGGNAIVGVSIACAKAAAKTQGQEVFQYLKTLVEIKPSRPVPLLFMNLINGGKHAQSKLAFQEYHIVPMVDSIEEALNIGTKIQAELKKIIVEEFGPTSANLGDEGGFVPDTDSTEKPLELLWQTIEKNNFSDKIKLAMDVAGSSFFKDEVYSLENKKISPDQLLEFYNGLIEKYPILSIEDPFQEEDFENFGKLLSGGKTMVIGDDLTVTNKSRLEKAIAQKSINGIIIKPNQIGTLTETLETMKMARENNIECVVSHRSGETNDDFIADLAYAFGCFGLKSGAPQREERIIKYNRLKLISSLSH